jgi:hypothetical protein
VRPSTPCEVGDFFSRLARQQSEEQMAIGVGGHGVAPVHDVISGTTDHLFFQRFAEPGPSVIPVPVRHRPGKPRCRTRFLDGQTTKEVEVSDL